MRNRIIIIIIILIAVGGTWYFYSKNKTNPAGDSAGSGFKDFFSFGNKDSVNNPDTTVNENIPGSSQGTIDQRSPFKQITPHTVAGYTIFKSSNTINIPASTPKGKPTTQTIVDNVLRYVSRNSGYVYEIRNSGTPIQISNVYVANVYEALFADGGKTAILRFLRDDALTIASYVVPIPDKNPDGTRTQKTGVYLPEAISSLAVSPDGSTISRITFENNASVISNTNTLNAKRRELLRNPFHEWLLSWGAKNVYLQTKASGDVPGFFYKIDEANRRPTRVLGGINGLTTSVSPNGTYVLYSESLNNKFITKIFTTKTGLTRNIGVSVLPEKCTWLKSEDLVCAGGGAIPEGVYPDTWYAGTTKFSDQVFRIYTQNNIFDVLTGNTDSESFDMTNLQIDEELNILYFIDKQTGLLWQFTL